MRVHDSTHASLAHTRLGQATTGHKQMGVKGEQHSRASVELAHAVVLVLRARHLDDVAVVVDELGLLALDELLVELDEHLVRVIG